MIPGPGFPILFFFMSLVSASGLGKHFGTLVLFRDAEFTLSEGTRVALIGPNGAGKTSLFRILLGDDEHDGRLSLKKDLRIATLEQDPRFPEGATVREAVLSCDAELAALEHEMREIPERLERGDADSAKLLARLAEVESRFEARGGWDLENRADRILEGVGFPRPRHGVPVEALSGGEQGRLAFARVLMQEPDLWLLDEPTNHLDIDGILFLERFLVESRASAIVISHDRRFLDRVTSQTWEIEGERLWRYPAPYSRSRVLREERLKTAHREFEIQQAWIEKEDAFIRRYGAGQRARQAQGRLKRLERLARLERPEDRVRVMNLRLNAGGPPGRKILAVNDLEARVDGRTLFAGLSLELDRGEVVGVAGPNGSGKTTLLRILRGEIPPAKGDAAWGERVRAGMLAQHEEFPDETATPYTFLRASDPRRTEQQLRNLLGAMLFPGDSVDHLVSSLSGGERKRLMLTRLLIEGNNVLMLDEPTNHLDIPSREALEVALATWEGTLILVSHDRHFLDQMADRMLWIEDGEAHVTLGGFTDALARREARRAARGRIRERARPRPTVSGAPPPAPAKPKSPFARLKTEELEERIMRGEARVQDLEAGFSRPEIYLDPDRLKETREGVDRLKAELAELEQEYLSRGDSTA